MPAREAQMRAAPERRSSGWRDGGRSARPSADCRERCHGGRGQENGLLLIDLRDRLDARRREREDKPV